MKKTLFSQEYRLLLDQLSTIRRKQGWSQEYLAVRLGATQSFVSKCERGERRLDVVELRAWCKALGVPFAAFAVQYEQTLAQGKKKNARDD